MNSAFVGKGPSLANRRERGDDTYAAICRVQIVCFGDVLDYRVLVSDISVDRQLSAFTAQWPPVHHVKVTATNQTATEIG